MKRYFISSILLCLFNTILLSADLSDLTYEITPDNTVTITGCETSATGALLIPETIQGYPVTSIGNYSFRFCRDLTNVNIPDSIVYIGNAAFKHCSGLTEFAIPNNVEYIGESAFLGCNELISVTIPDSVIFIGIIPFSSCNKLTAIHVGINNTHYSSIDGVLYDKAQATIIQYPTAKSGAYTLPVSVTSIGEYAFYGCSGLISVTIPDDVISIGSHAFARCSGLKNVTIPNSVTSMGVAALGYCSELTSVTLGDGITSIEESTFAYCQQLVSVNIPSNVTSIGSGAFLECHKLTSVTLPSGMLVIEDRAFSYCANLSEITIPGSVSVISDNAFSYCTRLAEITLQSGVTTIEDSAFSYSSSLSEVLIPGSLSSLGTGVFAGCESLTEIETHAENLIYTSIDGVLYTNDGTTLVSYPIGKPESTYTVPDGVVTIGDAAFHGSQNLNSIVMADSVTTIGNAAFIGCVNLTFINLGSRLTRIEERAFSGCSNLSSISIPQTVDYLGDSAFAACRSLSSVTFFGNAPEREADTFRTQSYMRIYYFEDASGFSGVGSGWSAYRKSTLSSTSGYKSWIQDQTQHLPILGDRMKLSANTDMDHYTNEGEFLFGGDPTLNDQLDSIIANVNSIPQGTVRVEFLVNAAATDYVYRIQTTTDPSTTWLESSHFTPQGLGNEPLRFGATDTLSIEIHDLENDYYRIIEQIPNEDDHFFIRILATATP